MKKAIVISFAILFFLLTANGSLAQNLERNSYIVKSGEEKEFEIFDRQFKVIAAYETLPSKLENKFELSVQEKHTREDGSDYYRPMRCGISWLGFWQKYVFEKTTSSFPVELSCDEFGFMHSSIFGRQTKIKEFSVRVWDAYQGFIAYELRVEYWDEEGSGYYAKIYPGSGNGDEPIYVGNVEGEFIAFRTYSDFVERVKSQSISIPFGGNGIMFNRDGKLFEIWLSDVRQEMSESTQLKLKEYFEAEISAKVDGVPLECKRKENVSPPLRIEFECSKDGENFMDIPIVGVYHLPSGQEQYAGINIVIDDEVNRTMEELKNIHGSNAPSSPGTGNGSDATNLINVIYNGEKQADVQKHELVEDIKGSGIGVPAGGKLSFEKNGEKHAFEPTSAGEASYSDSISSFKYTYFTADFTSYLNGEEVECEKREGKDYDAPYFMYVYDCMHGDDKWSVWLRGVLTSTLDSTMTDPDVMVYLYLTRKYTKNGEEKITYFSSKEALEKDGYQNITIEENEAPAETEEEEEKEEEEKENQEEEIPGDCSTVFKCLARIDAKMVEELFE